MNTDQIAALDAFAQMTILFHSASPWNAEKRDEWRRLQTVIQRYAYGDRPAQLSRDFNEATTKVLCDYARMALQKVEGGCANCGGHNLTTRDDSDPANGYSDPERSWCNDCQGWAD